MLRDIIPKADAGQDVIEPEFPFSFSGPTANAVILFSALAMFDPMQPGSGTFQRMFEGPLLLFPCLTQRPPAAWKGKRQSKQH